MTSARVTQERTPLQLLRSTELLNSFYTSSRYSSIRADVLRPRNTEGEVLLSP